MYQHSWFYRNSLFYTILALVLLIHLLLLAFIMFREVDLAKISENTSSTSKSKLILTLRKQVVQSEDPVVKTKSKNKSYLSDKNRSFERQSVARNVDVFKSSSQGGAQKGSINLSDLGAFKKGHHPLREAAKKLKAGVNSATDNHHSVSSTNDYVAEVPLGDLTYLNTVEYQYYGFYFRIRQKLEQFWGRSIHDKAESLAKKGRRIASEDHLITSLEIILNESGQVVKINLKGSSGVQELDAAAIESFNAAGPFPNPPKGLIVNGRVRIEWGFVVRT